MKQWSAYLHLSHYQGAFVGVGLNLPVNFWSISGVEQIFNGKVMETLVAPNGLDYVPAETIDTDPSQLGIFGPWLFQKVRKRSVVSVGLYYMLLGAVENRDVAVDEGPVPSVRVLVCAQAWFATRFPIGSGRRQIAG